MLTAAQTAVADTTLRVLLVGSREEDFFLVRDILSRTGGSRGAELEHATSLSEAKTILTQKLFDLILFEYDSHDPAAVHLLSDFRLFAHRNLGPVHSADRERGREHDCRNHRIRNLGLYRQVELKRTRPDAQHPFRSGPALGATRSQ